MQTTEPGLGAILRPILVESLIDVLVPWFLNLLRVIRSGLYGAGIFILKRKRTEHHVWHIFTLTLLFLLATSTLFISDAIVVLRGLDSVSLKTSGNGPPQYSRLVVDLIRAFFFIFLVSKVESGIIYPIAMIISLVIPGSKSDAVAFGLHHIVGIAPTLIIARAGLGHALQDTQSHVDTLGLRQQIASTGPSNTRDSNHGRPATSELSGV
ncbi:hypothetical protein PQX77_016473 [Marasmius sp. AFHP31]|nr:hypothetical protein PQX77_016473 [Marasmius sp. AFHP31]